MAQKHISFSMSLRTCIVVILIELSQEAPDFSTNQNLNYNSSRDYTQNTTFIPTVEDNDPDYPYEQLLQLVKDTKRILSSSNPAEKMRLNLDPQIYDGYLSGDLSYINLPNIQRPIITDSISVSSASGAAAASGFSPPVASSPSYDQCLEDVQYQIPRRLTGIDDKDYFIINVGNDLKQKYNAVICKYRARKCGPLYAEQNYSFNCEQDYSSIRRFVSIPVGNQISIEEQRLQLFKVPDGCLCKVSRIVN